MSHPSVARSLVLETTLFPEDVSLDRLQALLDQWEGDAPAAPFDPQAGWRAFRQAHPALFPRHPAGRALPPGLPDAPEDAGARLPAGGEIGVVEYVENRVSR